MVQAIHETVRVQKGGKLELQSDRLTEGQEVDVIVLPRIASPGEVPPVKSIFELKGAGKSFGSAEEVDRFIREERDKWDR